MEREHTPSPSLSPKFVDDLHGSPYGEPIFCQIPPFRLVSPARTPGGEKPAAEGRIAPNYPEYPEIQNSDSQIILNGIVSLSEMQNSILGGVNRRISCCFLTKSDGEQP